MTQDVSLSSIRSASDSQMRVSGTDPGVVAEYAESMETGAVFPAIILYFNGTDYWPADGFHRIEAARRIDKDTILAEVREGGQRDAILFAAGANASHGLRRSQADKRRSVETLLRDPEWSRWSDREIGKACTLDHKTVGKVRRELTGEIPTDRKVTYRDRHGNESEMKVSASGNATGSMLEKVLSRLSDEALTTECRRRGLEVRDV